MSNEVALKARFSSMETGALMNMWQTQERLPWANGLLRAELKIRHVPDDVLDQTAWTEEKELEHEISARDTLVGYGLLGRAGAILAAIAAGKIVGGLVSREAGLLASVLVIAVYVVLLIKRLLLQGKQQNSGASSTALVFVWIEASLLTCFVVFGIYSLVSGTNV